jgi:hypothetical protein
MMQNFSFFFKYYIKHAVLISLVIILFASFNEASKDENVFSGNTETYISELENYMTNLPEQYEDVLVDFIKAWKEDSLFDAEQQKTIVNFSRLLVERKTRSYPHYYRFMSCMLAFEKYNSSAENYKNWTEGFGEILEKRKTKTFEIENVLEFTDILLRENLLYSSSSTTWKVSNRNYKILNTKELHVSFDQVDLICYAKRDSMHLFQTVGTVYPVENLWKGQGGLVTWERGGYSRDSVYARLTDYQIDLTKSEYYAENVTFTNNIYFTEPLTGILEDKVKYNTSLEDATYPKFNSYTREYFIPDLYENIDYEGGLSMQGAKMIGTGTREKNAKLKIYRYDTLVLTASSVFFGFRADRVSSQRTSINIRLRNDSIYHPDLIFTYRVKNQELTLLKSDNYSSQGPYTNSYHKVDMNFEQLTWNMNEDFMRFTAPRGAAIGNAFFESVNYFNYNKFMNMMMLDQQHPLFLLKKFARLYGSDEFYVETYADFLKLPIHEVQQQAMRMAFGGFIYYDINSETIRLKPRLYDYLDASINKIDYDVIGFQSNVDAPLENAIYNIRTDDLIINGIPQIQVSDSQNVIIYPKNNRITLKSNRNFQFDGVVQAGLLTFFGKNFFFHYDSFKVNLQNVDSLKIDFLTDRKDNYGLPVIEAVRNTLEGITGEVLIDRSDNKSGRESLPQYPIFRSKQNSYVYYGHNNKQGNVYSASDFYFEVYPFEMDSLDNFNYRDLYFKGEFVSAGIFPKFEKQLSLQPDNSLGFRQMAPSNGYPVYEGKGTFYNEIWLSNNGLKGDGSLEYLTSTTWSKDFIFYPDSMNTKSDRYVIAQQSAVTEYPRTSSVHNYIHWMPYADVMYAYKTDTDFNMFNDSTFLNGNLQLEPKGLSGSGRMDLKNSDLESTLFTYKTHDIYSDTADFFLRSLYNEGFTVMTNNIDAHINYEQKKGWFKSNEGYTLVKFPDNKYISYIDRFVWDMNKKELAMGSETASADVDYTYEDMEPEGPRYVSVERTQDSLNFIAPLAYYDYKKNQINAKGVKFIEVADSRIYPDKGELTVEREAKMSTLENARIRTNKQTKYHTIHSAILNIASRKYFSGLGNFDYIDENNTVQNIHFNEIEVDSSLQTIASGNIIEKAGFKLSPVFRFQGKTFLRSRDSLLTFKGGVKVDYACEKPDPLWLYFQTAIDPNNIYIPLPEQPVDIDRDKIYAGMYMYYDSVHVYPSFMSMNKSYGDRRIISSHGYLYFDRATQLFKIGSKEKINDFSLSEPYLSLHREDCRLYGEGTLDPGHELGQLKLKTYGNITHDLASNETTLDVVLMVDFFMAEPMVLLMAKEIDSIPGLEPVDLKRPVWTKTLNATIGAEKAQRMIEELTLYGTIKQLPQELKHTFVFNDLKLKWNNETNSYISEGKIGIASINDVQINKLVDGMLELQIKRSGDIMDFYLQLDQKTYYYFGYTRGVMQTLSSNRLYVETIMNMKTKDRKMKVPRNQTSYIYMISTDRKKNGFYRRYRDILDGISPVETEQLPEP